MAEFKESVKDIITKQDAKFDKKTEKELQPLSLHIKEISSKQGEQANIFSSLTATYDYRIDNTSNKKKSAPSLK